MTEAQQQLLDELKQICSQYQREVPTRRRPWSQSIRERIFQLKDLGLTFHRVPAETGIPVMTLYSNQFEPTRSGKVAEEMLKDHDGSILTDGYGGYNRVKKQGSVRVGQCWSHARREFFERLDTYPVEAKEALEYIDRLFAIEARAKTFEDLKKLRRTESRDVIREFHAWILKTRARYLESTGLHQAIAYCLKFWEHLTEFTRDLSLPLSNNDAERALRHIVMGRKNFNGSKTINGADTAASLYTVIESCKRVGLQPGQYLKYLIEARWFRDSVQTPLERAMELLGPSKRIQFPAKAEMISTDEMILVSVTDQFGSLVRSSLLSHLAKDYERIDYRPRAEIGAGLGIYGIVDAGISLAYFVKPQFLTQATLLIPVHTGMKEFRKGFQFFSVIEK